MSEKKTIGIFYDDYYRQFHINIKDFLKFIDNHKETKNCIIFNNHDNIDIQLYSLYYRDEKHLRINKDHLSNLQKLFEESTIIRYKINGRHSVWTIYDKIRIIMNNIKPVFVDNRRVLIKEDTVVKE